MEDGLLVQSLGAAPWGRPYALHLRELLRIRQSKATVAETLNHLASMNEEPFSRRFIPALGSSAASYEARIDHPGEIESRENLHDLMNGLVWLTFPAAKAAINRVHVRAVTTVSAPHRRGPQRDAATLLDENGLIVLTDDVELADQFQRMIWQSLFVDGRVRFQRHCRAFLFGHALAGKLLQPYKSLTAHALILVVEQGVLDDGPTRLLRHVDRMAAERIELQDFSPRVLSPVPILGLPGWWPANENNDFYADRSVFRSQRRRDHSNPRMSTNAAQLRETGLG